MRAKCIESFRLLFEFSQRAEKAMNMRQAELSRLAPELLEQHLYDLINKLFSAQQILGQREEGDVTKERGKGGVDRGDRIHGTVKQGEIAGGRMKGFKF